MAIAKKPLSAEKALMRLETQCAAKEICSHEAYEKLRRWLVSPEDARKVVGRLVERRFIDDSRFGRAFVRDKAVFARWGRFKIAMALRQKGFSRDMIAEALATIDEDSYIETLDALIAAKSRQLADADSYEGRTKIFRFAASRGFEPTLIAEAIKRMKIRVDDSES